MKKLSNRLAILLVTLCFLLFPSVSFAEEITNSAELIPANRVIRVGFPIQTGFSEIDENGNYRGYTYDYLQEIAQYTGWEYEFVQIPGDINEALSTMLTMLSEGKLDLLGGVVKNAQTEKMFGFPEYGYGFGYTTLDVLEENTRIDESNYQAVGKLRIAIQEGATKTLETLQAFCQANNVEYELVTGKTSQDLFKLLETKQADAMVGNSLNATAGTRTVAQFNGLRFFFAVTPKNTDIVNELNRTILTIQQVKPAFESSLYDKYFVTPMEEVFLTEQEERFIESIQPLRVVLVDHIEPIQTMGKEGKLAGIAVDLLKKIEEKTKLKTELISASSYEEGFRLLEEGKADVICGIPYDYQLAQQKGVLLGNSFLSAPTVLVRKEDASTSEKELHIGIVNRLQSLSKTEEETMMRYNTAEECMRAVVSGEVDGAYLNMYTAEYQARYSEFSGLRLIPQAETNVEFCFGFRKPVNSAVVSVVNKVIAQLPPSEMESMIYQNTMNLSGALTLSMFVRENPFLTVGIVLAIFVLFSAILIIFVRMRLQASKKLAVESRRYEEFAKLANEFLYEYDCQKDQLSISKELARVFDLPHRIDGVRSMLIGAIAFPPSLTKKNVPLLTQMTQMHEELNREERYDLPSGEKRWYRCTQASIRDEFGKDVYLLGKFTDMQKEKEEKVLLEQQAAMDGLTGIYNAITLKQIIGGRLSSLYKPMALLIIDIDHFKNVNDKLGHYMGDVVLRDFAELLQELAGKHDIPGRLGGDEFVLLLCDAVDENQVSAFCEELCQKTRREYTNAEGAVCNITVSVGAGLVDMPCSFNDLYQAVDKQLYYSKENGRDRFTLMHYAPEKP